MLVWLVTVGEPLPMDAGNKRLLRTGILANLLTSQQHQVVWWTSTFDHITKKNRFETDKQLESKGIKINLLHSIKYKNNVSISRIINHYGIARKFRILSEREQKPDIILCSLPTIELSYEAVKYGDRHGVPVVLDARDLWPDIFVEVFPKWGHNLAKIIMKPMFSTVKTACAGATAITGITEEYVEWGLRYAARDRSPLDKAFNMGYVDNEPSTSTISDAEKFWETQGINRSKGEFIICFFGTLGRQFRLDTVIHAARNLERDNKAIRFVLCGTGDNLSYYKEIAQGCNNVIFPGWVGTTEIWTLMRMAKIGLAPYVNTNSFLMSYPNKLIEYLSAGLPVLSSIEGTIGRLLRENNCGITYCSDSADSLTQTLLYLFNNQEQLITMSKNSLELYQDKFVAKKVYSDMISYLRMICTEYNRKQGKRW